MPSVLWEATKVQLRWAFEHMGLIAAGAAGIWKFADHVKKFFTTQLTSAIETGVAPIHKIMEAHIVEDSQREAKMNEALLALKEKNGDRFDSLSVRMDGLATSLNSISDKLRNAVAPNFGD